MTELIMGAFIGSLAGAFFVDRQCKKHQKKMDGRLVATETLVEMVNKGLQATIIEQGDIIKFITKPHARIRKTSRSHKQ